MTRLLLMVATLLCTIPATAHRAAAQDSAAAHAAMPAGWLVRPDAGHMQHDGLTFTTMEPGWHVTTGPSVILYHPARTADGTFRLASEIFLFDPGQRREGFGILFGGRNLDGAAQQYVYFLIRRDGRFLVKRRTGEDTHVVRDWTEHDAIVTWDERGESATARNVLVVDAGADDVVFLINDVEVARVPRSEIAADGLVGLRVNHGLNLHVTGLDVSGS